MLPSLGAVAQSGDVVVTVATLNREALVVEKPASFIVSVENRGPSASAPVVVSITTPKGVEITRAFCLAGGLRCSFGGLEPGGKANFAFDAIIHSAPGPLTLEGTAEGTDVRPENAHFFVTLPVFPDPGVFPSIESVDRGDAQNRAVVRYVVNNASDRDSAARLEVDDISSAVTRFSIEADGWVCAQLEPTMTCSTQVIPAHGSRVVTVTYQLPSETSFLNTSASVNPATPDPGSFFPAVAVSRTLLFSRWFRVTSTADSGAGTLRQAIDDLDAQCQSKPCGIEFALEAPESSRPAIAPLSPLPPLRAWFVTIRGGGEAPAIFLDGSSAGDADGLAIEAQGADVQGLAIGRFAGNGLLLTTTFFPRSTIAHNAFGLDQYGNPAPNGLRGLRADKFTGDIVANTMTGNLRSGIFLTAASGASIHNNRLSGNGASGIFIGGRIFEVDLEGNTIEANGQFGIAVEHASDLTIGPNVIRDNGLQAIDIGLNGPSPGGVPVIGSVRTDVATGETVITGTLTPAPLPFGFYDHVDILLYATHSPRAEASQFLGVAHALDAHNFELRIAGPLQDCYVTGASITAEVQLDLGPVTFVSELGQPLQAPFPCGR